jgi:regulator of RNase E activity RraA
LKRNLPPAGVVEGFRSLPAANVADCMGRLSAISSQIRLLSSPANEIMVGVALTVKARPGDNLMIHKALDLAGPGDVIMVSNEGDRTQSLVGEVMVTHAQFRGIAGLVLDGPIRDIGAISKMSIPVYGAGVTPGGPFKDGPGEINVPIACGGIHVEPGDIVLGDKDGVIIIPRLDAPAILMEAKRFSTEDQGKVAAAAAGTLSRAWVDRTLEAKKCEIIDAVYGE